MTFAVYNPGGLGDCFLSLDLCNLIKNRFPNERVAFFTSKNAYDIIGDVLILQDNVDYLGFIENDNLHITKSKHKESTIEIKKIYVNCNTYTDIQPRQSWVLEFIEDHGLPDNHNYIIKYQLDTVKNLSDRLTIAVNDKSDWLLKRKYDLPLKDKVTNLLKNKYNADVIEIGQDNGFSYLENLRLLNNCHLYLGFFGSLSTFAAGVDVDTITYPTIMPPAWIHSIFYSSGWHRQVLPNPENHCKYYSCIQPRPYYYPRIEPTKIKEQMFTQFLGPPTIEDHNDIWGETCNHTQDKKSCISKMTLEDIDKHIQLWLRNRRNRQ